VATDLTFAMLTRARAHLRPGVHLAIGDGHELGVRSGSFDAVVLHLVLAVVPDPVRCLQESVRALRPGGRIVVFDKFTRSRRPSLPLRMLNVLSSAFFTHVTRRFEDVLDRSGAPLVVEHDGPAALGGFFRHILLRKPAR
jgi:ubiquinone/menaquinone biosynthesis C-methylase UbiE